MDHKKIIEEKNITDNLTVTTAMTYDEEKMFLIVDYMKGKFTIEKAFKNNYIGIEEFENTINSLNTEDKVKKYFGL